MIVDTAFALAPPFILVVGLVVVLFLTIADSLVRVGSVFARAVTLVTFALALAWTARYLLAGPINPFDFPLLSRLGADPGGQNPALPLETLHLDTIGLVGLVAILTVGLIATAVAEEAAVSRGTFAVLLFVALLGALMALSVDLMSIAALWVGTMLTLALVTLSLSHPFPARDSLPTGLVTHSPAIDARRWLVLVLIGTPAFWLAGSALVAVAGSASLVGGRPAPLSIVVGLIFIGTVVAGIAPFASRRLMQQRRVEIAFVIDGVLPVAGILLAARAVGMIEAPRPVLLSIGLAILGLMGVANAALALGRGGGSARVGRIEGSIALLALIAPTPAATVGSVLVVGIGALVRTLGRLSNSYRLAWLRWPALLAERPGATRPAPELRLNRITRRLALALNRRVPAFVLWLAEGIAEHARQVEQRYDLAVGLLIALATVFIYYG